MLTIEYIKVKGGWVAVVKEKGMTSEPVEFKTKPKPTKKEAVRSAMLRIGHIYFWSIS